MTFEQWLYEQMNLLLPQYDFSTVESENKIAISLTDGTDLDRWVRDSAFDIFIQFDAKVDASTASADVQRAITQIVEKPFVMKATIVKEQSRRENLPSAWTYGVAVNIRHRRLPSWQL